MLVASVDWGQIIAALITAAPAIFAAIFGKKIKDALKTPSGGQPGALIEQTHSVSHAHLALTVKNGNESATDKELIAEASELKADV